MSVLISILVAFHVLVCLLMVVVVLMQRPKTRVSVRLSAEE